MQVCLQMEFLGKMCLQDAKYNSDEFVHYSSTKYLLNRYLDKELMLARVENMKKEWATTRMSRCLVLEMVNISVERCENLHITNMLAAILGEVWKRVEVNRLLGEMEADVDVQAR